MQRSIIVILLAIVCGVSAAIGARRLAPPAKLKSVATTPVLVAARSIRRGAKVIDHDVKTVDWPADLLPPAAITDLGEVIGRSALTAITSGEPLMAAKLSDTEGSGYASNTIPAGMRACTIKTSGPSASVGGFVRPADRVDVLLNLRGSLRDENGGGSTLTLLQAAEILAIDDIMDLDDATVEMWLKEGVASVTLLVTPEQSQLLSLGQEVGSLSLALRNGNDTELLTDTRSVSINQIRGMAPTETFAGQPQQDRMTSLRDQPTDADPASAPISESDESTVASPIGSDDGAGSADIAARSIATGTSAPRPRDSYIFTLRGSQSGVVHAVAVRE